MIEGASNDTMQQQRQEGEPSQASPSPSFSSYSSETLAEIAARVINELRRQPQNDDVVDDDDPLFWENDNSHHHFPRQNDDEANHNDNDNNDQNDDFEFAFVLRDQNSSPVSADDIFYNGQIRPMYMYPLFGAPLKDAVHSASHAPNSNNEASPKRCRLPLRKLMFEERETGSYSSSTSENGSVDNLERIPEGTYCVWNPKAVARDRKKSNSTGTSSSSSKRWKFRELLLRSHSEGKGKNNNSGNGSGNNDDDDDDKKRAFVFGVPRKRTSKAAVAKAGSGDCYGGASVKLDGKSGRKSVLPYRQELIGLFANVNGLGRNLNRF